VVAVRLGPVALAVALVLVAAAVALADDGVLRKLDDRLWPRVAPATVASALVPVLPVERVGARIRVYVRLAAVDETTLAALDAAGAEPEIVDVPNRRVQALLDPARAADVATLAAVVAVRPADRGRTSAGAVTTEGDGASRADLVRALGYDGAAAVVGIVSDGIDHAASARASGDLPFVTVPPDPRCSAGSGDEGTALLEIVHDVAPGALLLFSGGATSGLAFARSVQCLVDAGATVIADDVSFFDEPFFEDGPVAATVHAAVAAGVSYHSAAGNAALSHVEQPYVAAPASALHDFGAGSPVDDGDDMIVPPGTTVTCILQWNDPFGASANDYDLELYDGADRLIAASRTRQDGTQDPLEEVAAANASAVGAAARVRIRKVAGADRLLDVFCLGSESLQHGTPAGSIVGQAGLPEVVAVGAIDVADPGLNDPEAFSSQGPVTIFFPSMTTRAKPDVVAFDGVSITNAGGFPGCPPECVFFGTSAAVPHAAGVAALLLSKNPFLAPADVAGALRTTAVDVGAPGFDEATGAGRIDALGAIGAVSAPPCGTVADCDDGNPCTVDSCTDGACTYAATACDDGDPCDGAERCAPGAGCVAGVPVRCDDGNPCNGTETCAAGVGCIAGSPLVCDDGDPCTADDCDPVLGCRATDLPGLPFVACALPARLAALVPSPDAVPTARAARLARRMLATIGATEDLVARADVPAARARKRLGRALAKLARVGRLARRARRDLGATVVDAIVLEEETIASKIRAVRDSL
jgi:hypothetical protein